MIDLNKTVSEKKNFFNRLIIIYTFFGLLFLYFLYKTFSLQVSSYTDYEIAALENKTREILIQPRRGIIFDRNGYKYHGRIKAVGDAIRNANIII